MRKFQTTRISIACATTALITTGCIDMTSDEEHNVGKFIDSPVVGLSYKTDSLEGRTNIGGEFKYDDGEYILFSIGDISFPLTPAQAIITPLNLADTNDPTDPEVVNILRLLQTLDKDADPENGIEISQEAHIAAKGVTLDLSSEDFATSTETHQYLQAVLGDNATLVDETQAIEHFTASLSLIEERPEYSFSASNLSSQTYYVVTKDDLDTTRSGEKMDNVYFDNGQFEYSKGETQHVGQYDVRNGILHLDYDPAEETSDTYIAILEEENNHLVTCWASTSQSSLGCEKEDYTRLFYNSDSASNFVDSSNGTTTASASVDTSTNNNTDSSNNESDNTNSSSSTDSNSSNNGDNSTDHESTTVNVSNTTNPNTGSSNNSTSNTTDTSEPSVGAAGSTGTKFNPGHYVFTNISRRYSKDERGTRRISFINQYKNNSYIKGFVGTYDWKYLEPSKNNYDFDNIRDILKMLEGTDKHYAVQIKERSFSSGCTEPPVPDYLMGYKYKYSGYVCMIKLYRDDVMDRQIALFQALGREFDNHPNLEFISSGETTIGGSDGYSGDIWTKQLIRFFEESKKALPNTIINIQMNFLESGTAYMDRIAASMAKVGGGGLGLPDTVPCRRTDIPSSEVCGYTIPGYDVLRKYNGKLAIMPNVETWDLIYEQTPDVLDMAVDYLGSTHVIWQADFSSRKDSRGHVPNYLENQVIPTVESQGGRIQDACPTALAPCL